MYCEDYPCCGHTPADPCSREWYDEPGAFDTTVNPHALCDHENGECDVFYDEDCCPECGSDEELCQHNECAYCCTPCNADDGLTDWDREWAMEAKDNAYIWGDA